MHVAKQQKNMLTAVAALKSLREPVQFGNFTWFEAVEVIATRPFEVHLANCCRPVPAAVRWQLSGAATIIGQRQALAARLT